MKRSMLAAITLLATGYLAGSCAPTPSVGSAGPGGVLVGVELVRNPSRVDMVSVDWESLPAATITTNVTVSPATLVIRFWASVACFGTNSEKYVQVTLDGTPLASAPMVALPPSTASQSQVSTSIQTSAPVGVGLHTVQVEARVGSGTSCLIAKDLWHLEVDTLAE